jgi:hypothetical protein
MDRGQVYTLEAFSAAVIMLTGLLFALQMTAVTPLTASTSSQHIENQQAAVAEAVLASADEKGTLEETLLYWDSGPDEFHGVSAQGAYLGGGPPTEFGRTLNGTFRSEGIAFNVNLYYLEENQTTRGGPEQLVFLGTPSEHAVAATRTVTLYDDDRIYDADHTRSSIELSAIENSYFAEDVSDDTAVYNVVQVEVVVWRM